ncbi:MAG TPA: hypothetical protein PLY30_04405, partial [Candidatus Omnitrophota bacterium]|nr:hypothetical protein [Candidatus Omnitrophota bacterium]
DSRAMLAAETEAMKKLLENPVSEALFDRMIEAGDILALAQNRTIDPARLPDRLVFSKGVERFEVRNEDPSLPDIEVLLQGTPRFKRFAQKYPFAIMKSGYANERFVVLPESPAALVLYRLIALDAGLYRAARNPEFVKLLEGLVAEILSSGIVERAA